MSDQPLNLDQRSNWPLKCNNVSVQAHLQTMSWESQLPAAQQHSGAVVHLRPFNRGRVVGAAQHTSRTHKQHSTGSN